MKEIAKKVSEGASSVVGIGKDLLETTKLEQNLSNSYKSLGQKLYEKHIYSGPFFDDHELLMEIKKIEQTLELLEACKDQMDEKKKSLF